MKTMKETIYEYIQKESISNALYKDGITTKQIAEVFQIQRSNVSAILNELVKDGKLEKTVGRPVLYKIFLKKDRKELVFIGSQGSLTRQLQIAKAAILYPKKSLPILICAKSGSGSSFFVEQIVEFAKKTKVISKQAPFIKVNARHYQKDNEQLEQLFFGKNYDLCESIFYKAKQGVLFIENVEDLEERFQRCIDNFLDNQKLYSEDHMEEISCEDVILIVSKEKMSTYLSQQKFSMIIDLPELKERPNQEKLAFIHQFFSIEASNANKTLEVSKDIIQSLLLTDFKRNIKELEIEIKKACAVAYIRVMDEPDASMQLSIHDFNPSIAKSLVYVKRDVESSVILNNQHMFYYDCHQGYICYQEDELYADIYEQYKKLSKIGIEPLQVKEVVNQHVYNLFRKYNYEYLGDYNEEQLSKIVDTNVILLVKELFAQCRIELHREYASNVFYGLCLHMNSLLTINGTERKLEHQQIKKIIENYPKEFAITTQFAKVFEHKMGVELSIDEIVIITMFLLENENTVEKGRPVLLYILHGIKVASALKDVTRDFIDAQHIYSYDLALEKNTQKALQEIKELIVRIDEGYGVIVIYDMGSIKAMLETIMEETHIKIRYMYIPITLLGIEIARRCMQEEDIDVVFHQANLELQKMFSIVPTQKNIIVTLCHTGDGGAQS